MLRRLAELNSQLIKMEDQMAESMKKIKVDLPNRCGLLAMLAVLTLLLFALFAPEEAQAKCTRRVADPLITSRYQDCNPKKMLSYLYNDLVTPYSFTCAKRITETCKTENCSEPKTAEDEHRCQAHYVQILNECMGELEPAAQMARCKDTKTWPETSALIRASQSATIHR